MRWPAVWKAMVEAMQERPEITDVFGDPPNCAIYLEGAEGEDREFQVPSLTGMLVVDTEVELWEVIDFQIDIWTQELETCWEIERVVRWLFHHDNRISLGDVNLWFSFVAGRTVVGPGKQKYFGRSLDFRAQPVRSKYLRVAES